MAVGVGPTVHAVQRLRVWTETTFCSDGTGTLGNFTDVPVKEGSMESPVAPYETIDHGALVQYRWDYREEIIGKQKPVQLKFTMALAPTGTAAGNTTAAVAGALGVLLKACMGGESLGTGDKASTGWTSSAGTVQGVSSDGFPAGNAVGWVNGSSVLEAREVEQQQSATGVTTKRAFSGTPANNDVLYASATYYLTSDPSSSLQFIVEGLELQDRWLLLGCQMTSVSLSLPIGSDNAIPEITFTFESTKWMYGDDCATNLTGSALGTATYSNFNPIAGFAGRFMVQTVTTATYTGSTVDVSAVSFDPKWKFQRVNSPSGTMATLRWLASRQSAPCVEGSFTTYFSDYTRFDWRDLKTDLALSYQIGTAAGSAILITAPTVQATEVNRVSDNGIAGETVKWKARKDGETVEGSSTDLGLSPFRIHLL